ncbi:MAG TPA: hypothetical protein VGB88_02535 [Alphaproteobacteria bacterium]
MSRKLLTIVTVMLLVSACGTGAVLPPPGPDHPASPDAAVAPLPSRMSALDGDAAGLFEGEGDAMAHDRPADAGGAMEGQHSMESME